MAVDGQDVSAPAEAYAAVADAQDFLQALEDGLRKLSSTAQIQELAGAALGKRLGLSQVAYAGIDEQGQYGVVERDWNDGSIPSNVGRHRLDDFGPPVATELRAGRAVVISDVRLDARTNTPAVLAILEQVSVSAVMSLPLVKEGRLVAVLSLSAGRPRVWRDDEITLAREVADRIWDTGARARAEQALRSLQQRQLLVLALLRHQRQSTDPADIMQNAAAMLGANLGVDRVGSFELRDDETLVFGPGWSAGLQPLLSGELAAANLGPAAVAQLRAGQTVGVGGLQSDPPIAESVLATIGARAWIGAPICRAGRWHAGLYVQHGEPRHWSEVELRMVREVAELTWDAVERARAQGKVADSEARLQLALKASGLGHWEFDMATGRSVRSLRHDEVFGHAAPPADWTYDHFLSHVLPEDRAAVNASLVQALRQRRTWTLNCRIRRVNGELRWIEVRGEPVVNAAGRVARLLGVISDVTERKLSEMALAESAARLQALTDSVDQMLWSTRPDGHPDFFNQSWYDFTGMLSGTTDGEAWTGVLHPDDKARAGAVWQHAVATGTPYHTEYRLRHHTGQYRWVLARARPVRDDAGQISRWYGTCTDIQEIVAARDVLTRSQRQLESLVEQRTRERDRAWKFSQDLQVVIDPQGMFRSVNDACSRILGWPTEQLIGQHYVEFVHADDREATTSALAAVGQPSPPIHENRMRHRSGEYRWVSWSAAPDGDMIYASGRHISAEKEARAQLEATQAQLRESQKMEALGQLTGGIAHDFNNLLAVISMSLALTRRLMAAGRGEEIPRRLDAAKRAADQAAALTHRLLAFGRRQTLDQTETDVSLLVAGMADLLRGTMGPSIELRTSGETRGWQVLVDRNQLENALLNLCLNARDAMPDGGQLTLRTDILHRDAPRDRAPELQQGDYVVLSVADTGCGMTPEVIARAFEPFFSTKPMGGGTGLGLSMVYGFARQSGGQVAIDSKLGRGSTLRLYLPRYQSVTGAAQADVVTPTQGAEPRLGHGETVLLVDDEPDLRRLLCDMLQELGYTVLDAADGRGGLDTLKSTRPIDLLITDIGLPGSMNGRQLADQARSVRPGMKVLFITGYAEGVLGQEPLDDATGLLTKPFTPEALAARLKDLLGR